MAVDGNESMVTKNAGESSIAMAMQPYDAGHIAQ